MCRNIKPLFNYNPPANQKEIHEASLQFVRKISGFQKPSEVNEKAFNHAIEHIDPVIAELLYSLKTTAKPKDRKIEAAKAHERAVKRFGVE
jgi:hypothetical protein